MMNGIHFWWWVFPLLILGVIGWMMWRPTRSLQDGSKQAEKIARRLYAAGEIDEAEYRERLSVLRR